MASALQEIKDKIQSGAVEADISGIEFEQFTQDIKKYLESCKKLEVLVVSNCGLTSLKNFPSIKSLQALDLSSNSLSDDCQIEELLNCKELTQIFFNENDIQNLDTIMKLKSLEKLIEIDCEGNKVSEVENYREQVFKQFSVIQIVDKKDREGNDVLDEEEEQFDDDDEEDDEEEYEEEDDDQEFDEDDYEEEDSDPKPRKKSKRK